MVTALTVHYIRNLSLPYSLSWWAFISPLGAFTSTSNEIGATLGLNLMRLFGYTLLWCLLVLWSVTFTKTLRMSVGRSGREQMG